MIASNLSVFIPTYNNERTIGAVIDAVVAQSVQAARLIVIDSGSSDSTCQIAAAKGAEVFGPKDFGLEFLGLAKARNRVMEVVDTTYLLSIDSDVLLEPKYIEKMMSKLLSDDGLAGIGAKQIELYRADIGDHCRATIEMRDLGVPINVQIEEHRPFLLGSNNIYKVSALRHVGEYFHKNPLRPFDDNLLNNYEDASLGECLNALGYKMLWTPEVLTFHLQKDTLNSYIERAYRYRVFKWRQRDAFADLPSYAGKCEHNINYVEMGRAIARSKNRLFLMYPMLLTGFMFFCKDAIEADMRGSELAGVLSASIHSALERLRPSILAQNVVDFVGLQLPKPTIADEKISSWLVSLSMSVGAKSMMSFLDECKTKNTHSSIYLGDSEKLSAQNRYCLDYEALAYNADELFFEIMGLGPTSISNIPVSNEHIGLAKHFFKDIHCTFSLQAGLDLSAPISAYSSRIPILP